MTGAFCQTCLTEEYAALCRKLAEKLAAKRPSPLPRGKLATWACGIIRTIGWVNFLDDRSQSPHLKLPEIDQAFGVAESTGQGKAKAIRRLLKIRQFDHRWMLPSRWESDPIIWTLQDSNGFMVDIRQQPVAMQRAAFRRGLIPYVPADRAAAAVQARVSTSSSRRLFQFKITLAKAAAEMIELRQQAKASGPYLTDLRCRITPFTEALPVHPAGVTTADCQRYLDGLNGASSTKNATRQVLWCLFAHCESRGYIPRGSNPVAETQRFNGPHEKAIEVWTPAEMVKLLANAASDFLPCLGHRRFRWASHQ